MCAYMYIYIIHIYIYLYLYTYIHIHMYFALRRSIWALREGVHRVSNQPFAKPKSSDPLLNLITRRSRFRPSLSLSLYLSVSLSLYLSLSLSIYIYICIHLSIYLSIYLYHSFIQSFSPICKSHVAHIWPDS